MLRYLLPFLGLLLLSTSAVVPVVAQKEVHAFFYLWYGNPETDGKWLHWDHEILQHWNPTTAAQYPKGKFQPPGDVGATYYPQRGLYSSCDPATLEAQCAEMKEYGIDVAVASWWPRGRPDGQGVDTDRCVRPLLDAAEKTGLKVAFHYEPYEGRNLQTVIQDFHYLRDQYGSHPALHKHHFRHIPMIYIYDSYHIPSEDWAKLLAPGGPQSIRGTDLDMVAISLFLNKADENFVLASHFDGIYTYFATDGFTWASSAHNWQPLLAWCREYDKIFIPSVGPGYDDTRLRPWNAANKRPRVIGSYFRNALNNAIGVRADYISITSYNEWGEGTQIEPAVAFTTDKGERLMGYEEHYPDPHPNMYLRMVKYAADQFKADTHMQQKPPEPPTHEEL